MKTENVYLCDIYQLTDVKYDDMSVTVDDGEGLYYDDIVRIKRKSIFVKQSLVYYSTFYNCFIDLQSKERYNLGFYGWEIGELFIEEKREKKKVSTLYYVGKKHISKRKILKRHNEELNGGRKE